MTIYLDTCALNRLTDDLAQPRIRREADAVARILIQAFAGEISWTASTVLHRELSNNPDPIRRQDALSLFANATSVVDANEETASRATHLIQHGLGTFDALHLAIAEQAQADVLVTTDDRFLKRAQSLKLYSRPEILNPVDWLQRRQPWLLPKAP